MKVRKTNMEITTSQTTQDKTLMKESSASMVLPNTYLFSRQKRVLDLVITILSLPLTIPVMLISAFFILITSGYPIAFKQKRIGKQGKVFLIYKLRTIRKAASSYEGVLHSNGDITVIGKILRIFRFDEFPQIWNIMAGEMSWVGPRPEVPYYVDKYTKLNPRFSERLEALPGVTGLAQVKNPNATPLENLDKLEADIEYIRNANLMMDIKIILNTFFLIWK